MANNDIEIEIKFPLLNAEKVSDFLDEKAKLLVKDVWQKDTYYVPAHRDFLSIKYPFEWLRLRETEQGSWLNYKHFYPENVQRTDYCDEFESKIEDLEAVQKIFTSLDIKEVVVVEKVRSIWIFEDVEVALDRVTDLGTFMELEATTDLKDPKEGKQMLYSVLEKLNARVGDEELLGYPYMALENKGYKFEE